MPALEPLVGLRVVATPSALSGARWSGDRAPTDGAVREILVLPFAPDEAFAVGARDVMVDDADAIVVAEGGFVGAWCTIGDLDRHIEWPVPPGPALAQGRIAGVPAKLWVADGHEQVFVVTHAAYADELAERLGWPR